MKAIRAWHASETYYTKVFKNVANMSLKDYYALTKGFDLPKSENLDCTNRLTVLRENLSNAGYATEVERADARFLAEHRGFKSEKDWEDFWHDFCISHGINPRKDAL